jgi:hypothetical protein
VDFGFGVRGRFLVVVLLGLLELWLGGVLACLLVMLALFTGLLLRFLFPDFRNINRFKPLNSVRHLHPFSRINPQQPLQDSSAAPPPTTSSSPQSYSPPSTHPCPSSPRQYSASGIAPSAHRYTPPLFWPGPTAGAAASTPKCNRWRRPCWIRRGICWTARAMVRYTGSRGFR